MASPDIMKAADIPIKPPPRLFIREVMAYSGYSRGQISEMEKEGTFPKPIYRCGQGNVYNGLAVYKALGFVVEKESDPFYE